MPQEKMTMDQVRERFPEYDDMDDMTLANALHGRFYSDIPLASFYEQVGFNPQQDAGDNGIYPEMRAGATQSSPIDLNANPNPADLRKGAWVVNREGVVYQLPEDARTAPNRMGDVEESPGVYTRPFSAAADIAKSIPTGIVEGATGLVGMQGAIGQMLGAQPGQNLPGFGIVGPTGEQLNDRLRESLGRDYYQPQSVLGEYARTAGEFLPGAVAPGGFGAKMASWLVPAAASETAGQFARALEGGERGTGAEEIARFAGGFGGGLAVGGVNAFRSGADNVLRSAAEGVTPDQLNLAAALRARSAALGIDITNANALQQVTGGATGLGRVERVVEGATNRLNPMIARRPQQVEQAIGGVLDQIGPSVEPSQLAGQGRAAANTVLERTRARINAEARPFYGAADDQVVSAEEYAALREIPTYREAEATFYGNPELSGGAAGPQSVGSINRIIQEMDTLARQADPGNMAPNANATLARVRGESADLAKGLVDTVSPDYAQARAIGAAGRQNALAPLQRGPIGSIAAQQELQPNLAGQTRALFPAQPFEGQADETAQALRLMGEVDPSVPGPLVRQFLAQQAAEAGQANVGGANPFGGAKFAAQTFGNPLQRETVLGAVDAAAPLASRDVRDLVEALAATGQREPAGSNTSFNTQMLQDLRGGNAATGAVQGITNPLGIPGRIAGAVDDWTARRNAETLADLLVANSDEFGARLTRAINRPRGANRIRAGVAVGAGQED